ncbi:MAG: beta-lactamase family protein, partial [Acidobacteria bacterium]|nr:beta-lactamase family protein [Acidobacteriota bacterium]
MIWLRSLLMAAGAVLAVGAVPPAMQAPARATPFDVLVREFAALLSRWHIPGGQLAVAKGGRLVLDAAIGEADAERGESTTPRHLFRIGSVSKALTTVAVLQLVERGWLRLDDTALDLLPDLLPTPEATQDPRLRSITVAHLLRHEGGWERFDALELPWSRAAAGVVGAPDPPDCVSRSSRWCSPRRQSRRARQVGAGTHCHTGRS